MIDSHFHIWQLQRGDYGWLTPDSGSIFRDVGVADWQAQAGANEVSHGILVQAAPSVAETEFLLHQAALHPQHILGVVGWVDLAPTMPGAHRATGTQSLVAWGASDVAGHCRPALDHATQRGGGTGDIAGARPEF